jgi:hypothetical protein
MNVICKMMVSRIKGLKEGNGERWRGVVWDSGKQEAGE